MKIRTGPILLGIGLIAGILILTRAFGKVDNSEALVNDARTQVERLADDLDSRTTPAGVYIRARDDEVEKADPWGTPLEVAYFQGGLAEVVRVRSAGPDRKFHTDDDVVAQRMAANFKGAGEGIKRNAEETAANAAKGLVKGAVQGFKESIRDALPKKKADQKASPDNTPAAGSSVHEIHKNNPRGRPEFRRIAATRSFRNSLLRAVCTTNGLNRCLP